MLLDLIIQPEFGNCRERKRRLPLHLGVFYRTPLAESPATERTRAYHHSTSVCAREARRWMPVWRGARRASVHVQHQARCRERGDGVLPSAAVVSEFVIAWILNMNAYAKNIAFRGPLILR